MLSKDTFAFNKWVFIQEIISIDINLRHPKKYTEPQRVGWGQNPSLGNLKRVFQNGHSPQAF